MDFQPHPGLRPLQTPPGRSRSGGIQMAADGGLLGTWLRGKGHTCPHRDRQGSDFRLQPFTSPLPTAHLEHSATAVAECMLFPAPL